MAWSKTQQVDAVASGTTVTLTLNGVTAGALLTLQLSYYRLINSTLPPSTPSDTNGTLLIAALPNALAPVTSGDSIGVGIWYERNAAAGTHTVTVTLTGSSVSAHGTLIEWVGGDGTADQQANDGAVNSNQSRTSGTTPPQAQSADLALACVVVGSTTGQANAAVTDPPAGFVSLYAQQNTATDIGTEFARAFLASNAAASASWSWTDASTVASMGAIATFLQSPPPVSGPLPEMNFVLP